MDASENAAIGGNGDCRIGSWEHADGVELDYTPSKELPLDCEVGHVDFVQSQMAEQTPQVDRGSLGRRRVGPSPGCRR
jgi:hypothetical protein